MNPDEDDVLARWFRDPGPADGRDPGPGPVDGGAPDTAGEDLQRPPTHFDGARSTPGRRPHGRRLARLLVVTAVLWLTAGALVLRGSRADAPDATDGTPSDVPAAAGQGPGSGAAEDVSGGSLPTAAPATAGPSGSSATRMQVAACAEMALHELLTRDDGSRWVDAAAAERLTPIATPPTVDGAAVEVRLAVVRAMVLTGDGESWQERRHIRYALPVDVGAGECRPLAGPWALPREFVEPAPSPAAASTPAPAAGPTPTTANGAADDYAAALTVTGYREVTIHHVEAGGDIAVADVEAIPPSGSEPERLEVWLHGGTPARLVGS